MSTVETGSPQSPTHSETILSQFAQKNSTATSALQGAFIELRLYMPFQSLHFFSSNSQGAPTNTGSKTRKKAGDGSGGHGDGLISAALWLGSSEQDTQPLWALVSSSVKWGIEGALLTGLLRGNKDRPW